MRLHFTAILLVLLLIHPTRADETPKPRGEKITLKLNLKKGEQRPMVHRVDLTSTYSVQGQTLVTGIKYAMHLGTKVEDVDADKLHTIKLTYDRITADLASPLGGFSYDSKEPDKAPANNPTVATFSALIGQSIALKVGADGVTKEVLGVEELSKKVQEKIGPGLDAKLQLDGMKNAFEQFAAYPDKPVDIGDSWKRKTKVGDASLGMEVDATYTLIDRRKGVAVIKMEGTMTAKGMKGTSAGVFNMEEATGWVTAGEMTMDLSGEAGGAGIALKGKSTVGEK